MAASMVDDVVVNKAAIIERCIARVREVYAGDETHLMDDMTRQDSMLFNLQRSCEAAIDLAMHVARDRRLGVPQQSREAFSLLEDAGLLDAVIAARMRAMVGFRNIAIHNYRALDLAIIKAIIERHLDEFTDFTAAMLKLDAPSA